MLLEVKDKVLKVLALISQTSGMAVSLASSLVVMTQFLLAVNIIQMLPDDG